MTGSKRFKSTALPYFLSLTFVVASSGALPAFADDEKDLPKGVGPCRSKVEELHATRKKLKDCLHAWVQAAKNNTENPGDDCESLTESFVDKAKEIKACRAEQMKEKAKTE